MKNLNLQVKVAIASLVSLSFCSCQSPNFSADSSRTDPSNLLKKPEPIDQSEQQHLTKRAAPVVFSQITANRQQKNIWISDWSDPNSITKKQLPQATILPSATAVAILNSNANSQDQIAPISYVVNQSPVLLGAGVTLGYDTLSPGPTQRDVPCPAPHADVPFHPADEYLCDGGDAGATARISRQNNVLGLQREDTVAHFETPTGETKVEPSNRVCIYAPRFSTVRKITGANEDIQAYEPTHIHVPVGPESNKESTVSIAIAKPHAPLHDVGIGSAMVFREKTRGVSFDTAIMARELTDATEVEQNFQLMRIGILKRSEKAELAEHIDAAQTWTNNVEAEVILNNLPALVDVESIGVGEVYQTGPDGKSRLRLVKIATPTSAQPGDEVEFTLRFDNIGDQMLRNVTLLDNLTTRLEYIPDSAACSKKAEFSTSDNESESLKLRWEVTESIPPGDGGIIQFRCKVR